MAADYDHRCDQPTTGGRAGGAAAATADARGPLLQDDGPLLLLRACIRAQ